MNKNIKSILVLTVICIVVGSMLAVVNHITAPIIAEANRKKALESCFVVMKDASDFEDKTEEFAGLELPSTIKNIYKEKEGKGYVFKMETTGYKSGLVIMCGINSDGKITGVTTISSEETANIGKKTEDEAYESQYIGKDQSLKGVEKITGATITSTAYKKAIQDAFTAYDTIKGGNNE